MKNNKYVHSGLIIMAVSLFQYSCNEVQPGKPIPDTSTIGYYKNNIASGSSRPTVSMTFKRDSTVLYLTDYNNFTPEIALRGTWRMDENDSTAVKIIFNDEIMRFKKTEDRIDLIENHNFGKIGLTELRLFRSADESATPKTLIMWVASSLGTCDTTLKKKCLRVRWGNDNQGNYFVFSDSVINFKYREGFSYKLKIERRVRPGLPPDSIAYLYELKEQLISRKDSI